MRSFVISMPENHKELMPDKVIVFLHGVGEAFFSQMDGPHEHPEAKPEPNQDIDLKNPDHFKKWKQKLKEDLKKELKPNPDPYSGNEGELKKLGLKNLFNHGLPMMLHS